MLDRLGIFGRPMACPTPSVTAQPCHLPPRGRQGGRTHRFDPASDHFILLYII